MENFIKIVGFIIAGGVGDQRQLLFPRNDN